MTLCDEERCAIGPKGFALDQIARIELRSGVAVPAAAGAGSIVMVDGTVKVAQFTGLNLGVVNIDGAEIDRDQVAVIILAGPPATGGPGSVPGDVLIMADGTRRVGRLTTCTAASCRLDSKLVPLNAVRWIGLLAEGGTPPQAEDTADIIFRKEQAVGARLEGIDATTVRSTHGNFAREDVLWIHLAGAVVEPPKGAIPATETTGPQPPPPPPPAPVPKPATQPGPSKPAPGGASHPKYERGGLWSGQIHIHYRLGDKDELTDIRTDISAHLREFRYPLLRPPAPRATARSCTWSRREPRSGRSSSST